MKLRVFHLSSCNISQYHYFPRSSTCGPDAPLPFGEGGFRRICYLTMVLNLSLELANFGHIEIIYCFQKCRDLFLLCPPNLSQ